MSERNEFPCDTTTDFVAVRRYAVEWLKTYYPALTIKAGLCEGIGGRLYTRTVLATHPLAATVPQQEAGEPVGVAGAMPGTSGFTMACFKAEDVPAGTKLYAAPTPQAVKVPLTDEQLLAVYRKHYPAVVYILGEERGHIAVLACLRDVERMVHGIHPTEGERSHD